MVTGNKLCSRPKGNFFYSSVHYSKCTLLKMGENYMNSFFKNALKTSIASLVTSIILYVVIIGFFLLSVVTASAFGTVIKVTVPVLTLVTILGFIYSFFIKGKQKITFLTLHFVSLFAISFGIYLTVSFQGFAP